MKTIIAIDPGASGGIAIFKDGSTSCYKMPEESELAGEIEAASFGNESVVILENVGGFVKGCPAPGSAMFNFGAGWGYIQGLCAGLKIPVHLVRPQKWQGWLGLGKSEGNKTAWKNKLKNEAKRRYPNLTVTHSTADALLILEWARENKI